MGTAACTTATQMYESDKRTKMRASGQLNDIPLEDAFKNTRKALEAGVLKILSKIGISLLSSYHGAQVRRTIGDRRRHAPTAPIVARLP